MGRKPREYQNVGNFQNQTMVDSVLEQFGQGRKLIWESKPYLKAGNCLTQIYRCGRKGCDFRLKTENFQGSISVYVYKDHDHKNETVRRGLTPAQKAFVDRILPIGAKPKLIHREMMKDPNLAPYPLHTSVANYAKRSRAKAISATIPLPHTDPSPGSGPGPGPGPGLGSGSGPGLGSGPGPGPGPGPGLGSGPDPGLGSGPGPGQDPCPGQDPNPSSTNNNTNLNTLNPVPASSTPTKPTPRANIPVAPTPA